MRVDGYLAADFDEFVAEEALEEGEEFVDRGVAPEHRRLIFGVGFWVFVFWFLAVVFRFLVFGVKG